MTASIAASIDPLQNLPQEIVGWMITLSGNISSAARVSRSWNAVVKTFSFRYIAEILRQGPLEPFMLKTGSWEERVYQLHNYIVRFRMAYDDLRDGLKIEGTEYPSINILGKRNPPKDVFKTAEKICVRLHRLSLSPQIDPTVKESFLMAAARYGLTSVLEFLPEEVLTTGAEKALLLAVQNNNIEIVQSLLQSKPNISDDTRGFSTIAAVQNGNTAIVRLLLLDCDTSDVYKELILEAAINKTDVSTIRFLLDRYSFSEEIRNRVSALAVAHNRWDIDALLHQIYQS